MTKITRSGLIKAGLSASVLTLAACGGGGGGGGDSVVVTPPPPPPPPVSRYEPGVFKPSSEYRSVCNAEDEKFFLRSFTNETYLWYDEVPDLDPTVASEGVQDYFDRLKTSRTTDSGRPVDEFHFSLTEEEFNNQVSGVRFGYGVEFVLLRSAPEGDVGRDIRVSRTAAGTTAAEAGLTRGARLVSIDGVDVGFGNDVDTLNAGLFPAAEGEEHTFVFTPVDGGDDVSVTLTSGSFTRPDIQATEVFTDGSTKTAYVHLNTFGTRSAEKSVYDTFTDLADQNVDNLVLDLRYNGGGYVAVACQLGYIIAGADDSTGKICTQNITNDKLPNDDPFPFINRGVGFELDGVGIPEGTPMPELDVDKVTVLSTRGTASASELMISSLDGIDIDISLVGDNTRGKPYGFSAEPNCGHYYYTIQFKTANNKGFGDYADGFIPTEGAAVNNQSNIKGCVVDDDFSKGFGDPTEDLLAAALQFQDEGTCPSAAANAQAKGGFDPATDTMDGLGIIDAREGALGQERRIIVQRLIDAGLISVIDREEGL